MLTMGLTGRLLTDWLGDGVLSSYGVRFVSQVWPGDTLTAKATVQSIAEKDGCAEVAMEIVTSNQKGQPVVKGRATATLPLEL
jgi:acyl dehydratase